MKENELVKAKELRPENIKTPKQGAEESKLLSRAVAAAKVFGMKRQEVNEIAEKLVRHVRRTGELIEKLERQIGGDRRREDQRKSDFALFLNDAALTPQTARNWQSVYSGYTDQEFEAEIERMLSAYDSYIALSDFYKRLTAPPVKEDVPTPEGKFKTLIIDPPWPMEKILREVRPNQDAMDYPTEAVDEILALPVADLADPSGCHVYLWFTQKYRRVAFELFDAWGVKDECFLTWVKNVGFTPYSWMYSTEHVMFGRIGSLPLLKLGLRLDFAAKVREHSRKPDEFYELVKQASPEPRLEMFCRERRDGFKPHGNEVEKFAGRC